MARIDELSVGHPEVAYRRCLWSDTYNGDEEIVISIGYASASTQLGGYGGYIGNV